MRYDGPMNFIVKLGETHRRVVVSSRERAAELASNWIQFIKWISPSDNPFSGVGYYVQIETCEVEP